MDEGEGSAQRAPVQEPSYTDEQLADLADGWGIVPKRRGKR